MFRCCTSGLVDAYNAQVVAWLDLINSEAEYVLEICVQLLTLLYAITISCHTHHHGVSADVKVRHCSRPAHADIHSAYSNRVKSCRLRRGQMLDKVKAKLQASVQTCKLSGAQGQAAPWMTSGQRSKSIMTASIYRQAVHPCHDHLLQCMRD